MSSYSALHGDLAKGLKLSFRGKDYYPRLIVQEIKEKVEEHLEERNRKNILKWKDTIPPADFMLLVNEHEKDVNEGRFWFQGKECTSYMATPEGGILLVCLLFNCDKETAIAMMLEEGAELSLLLASIKGRSAPNA